MKRLISMIQKHRLTALMLLFVLIFYGIAIFGGPRAKSRMDGVAPAAHGTALTGGEFKEQEEAFQKNLLKNPALMLTISLIVFLTFAGGLLLDARFLWNRAHGRHWISDGLPHQAVAWDWAHVLQATVFLFFSESVLLILETLFYLAVPSKNPPHDYLLMLNSILRDTMVALFILILARRMGHKLDALGLTTRDFWKNVGRGVTGYLAVLPLLFVSLLILSAVVKYFSYEPPPQNVVQIYLKKSSDPYLLFFTIFVAGAGPIIEEIFFRGFTYKAFRQKFGIWPAMIITSVIFSAFHMNLTAFVPIFIIGMMLCYLYEETGSLVPSMTAHMLHNLLMVNFTLGFKSMTGA